MNRERTGGWVYIMANRYRGAVYVGVTSDLAARISSIEVAPDRIFASVMASQDFVWAEPAENIAACMAHEKQLKRWRRDWKFALIERANPDRRDLFDTLD